jgi:hypothetical protein
MAKRVVMQARAEQFKRVVQLLQRGNFQPTTSEVVKAILLIDEMVSTQL